VIADLPSGNVHKALEGVEAPAYAPDGKLYVRNGEYQVLEVVGTEAKVVGAAKKPKRDPNDPFEEPPSPVEFDAAGKWQLPGGEKPAHHKHKAH
jgi:hypothetical protein